MYAVRSSLNFFSLIVLLIVCGGMASGCTESDAANEGIPGERERAIRTNCGIVYDGQLVNPVALDEGEEIDGISFISADTFLLNMGGVERLITLHGVGPIPQERQLEAIDELISISQQEVLFFRPEFNCRTQTPTGVAEVGQLLTRGGRSFTEQLIENDYVTAIPESGPCGVELLTTCYRALLEQ